MLVVALKSGETVGHLERAVAAPVSELLTLHEIVVCMHKLHIAYNSIIQKIICLFVLYTSD